MNKKITFLLLMLFLHVTLFSQVTTSSMSGVVLSSGKTVLNANILVVHEPSGSAWGTVTNAEGHYNIQGLRVGGPYSVECSFVGKQTQKVTNIYLSLGTNYNLDFNIKDSQTLLDELVITAEGTNDMEYYGTSTIIDASQIEALPTINRNVDDIIKISPYAGLNNSFGGVDGRYNNITVDGASFKNGYGMTSSLTPGGEGAPQPFSMDAIEEVNVSMSPFDIRQSKFTGANINLVTCSGDNTFKGSAYTFQRPKSFTGNKVGDEIVTNANELNSRIYGLRLGGPIIKNKLFFFINGEYEQQNSPGNEWSPSTDGNADVAKKISRTTVSDLETMKNFLLNNYSYDPGDYQNFGNLTNRNYKLLARLDWNINHNNKFSLRYSYLNSLRDQLVTPNASPDYAPIYRNSSDAISFSNSNYAFLDKVSSITAELNSNIGNNLNNTLLVNFSNNRSTRKSDSDLFPFVDIWKDGKQYMSFGYDLFSYGTDLTNNVLEITDNLTYYLGDHFLTLGMSFNYMTYANKYRQYGSSYYRFDSPEAFMNDEMPSLFALTYGFDSDDPEFRLNFGMAALYLQDEWRFYEDFTITYGLRLETPFYFNKLKSNSAIDELVFEDDYSMISGSWPETQLMFSPRVSFNWDVPTKQWNVAMRGGAGVFTGLLPFVWCNEQASSSGVVQNYVRSKYNVPFVADYHDLLLMYPEMFPDEAQNVVPSAFTEVAKDFKMPQVLRTNLAFDIELPADLLLTLEAVYSKDINAVMQKNVNLSDPSGKFSGSDQRLSWWLNDSTEYNRINDDIDALLITNSSKGYQYSLTSQLVKNFSYGFSGMLAYTYNVAKNVTDNDGTRAVSRWQNNYSVNSLNDEVLSYSGYSIPHTIVGALGYKVEYAKHLGTTFSMIYRGSAQARYSFIYANDMNGDGSTSDLMYVPNSVDDIIFVNTEEMTAAEQSQAFMDFVSNDEYLNSRRGDYAERNGYLGPWINRFDLRILQDVFVNSGRGNRYTLQLSLDVLNVANIFNSSWGVRKIHGFGDETQIALLEYAGMTESGAPTYKLNASNIAEFQENARWFNDVSTSSTWGCLVGLRLLF